MDRAIGNILRFGVALAALVVLAGGLWLLFTQGGVQPAWSAFRAQPSDLRSVGGVWKGVLAGRPLSWIQFGILLLIATPVARVVFAVFAFAAERDRAYVVVSTIVLVILLYSLVIGGL